MFYLEFRKKFYIANKAYKPGFYKVEYSNPNGTPISIMYNANRIWAEKDGEVTYFKHRELEDAKVDMKEFTWIKLKAYELPRQF